MTIDLLIHAIVRQTTLLIAQLATAGGGRAPLAQVATQVFLDLVRELERQGVSRKVSADMFGMGLRTYQRKIQRFTESSTDRGHSLWAAVFDHIQSRGVATRGELLLHFAKDDEAQVRSVLHDLVETGLASATGSGTGVEYRITPEDELRKLRATRRTEGLDELVWALIYREGPLSLEALVAEHFDRAELEASLARLVAARRVDYSEADGRYRAGSLLVPLGAPSGWEAAVFDHFKALVNTIIVRLQRAPSAPELGDRVGGSTYTLEVWPGHPHEAETYATLSRLRSEVRELRARVEAHNAAHSVPDDHTRVLVYVGQCLIDQEGGSDGGA